MSRLKEFLLLPCLLLMGTVGQAKVEMPSLFSDHMVLQQKAQVAVWGTATGKKVSITASWTKGKTVAEVDETGKWFVRLETPDAGGPYELCFDDGEKKVLHNVLVGEVWLCSGQSNMEMPMRGWPGQPVEHATEYILGARPEIPIRTIDFRSNKTGETWKENRPEVVYEASSTAYFFACQLYDVLRVPIGLITAVKGGSPIESWISRDILEKEFPSEINEADKNPPAAYYDGILSRIFPFTFKGMIWYQGEDNRERYKPYASLQARFVQMIREESQNPDAPFYFVQIAPFAYSHPDAYTLGYFNEAQQRSLALIPRSGMVPAVDLGNRLFIHPPKKREVGNRLAMLALVNDYGFKGVDPIAPCYKSVVFEDGKARVTVEVKGKVGLVPAKVPVSGFELAGEDRVFHPAVATAYKDEILVESPEVSAPVAVRYCFKNWSEGTLFNANGIPLLPFRTDDWEEL